MTSEKKYDVWRDSPLRFAGYCNEVGEAFAPIFPRLLIPSYALSIGYVFGDTFDKALIASKTKVLTIIVNEKRYDNFCC